MFLTGLADFYIDYEVTRTLAYGFEFNTFTLGELAQGIVDRGVSIVESILGIF